MKQIKNMTREEIEAGFKKDLAKVMKKWGASIGSRYEGGAEAQVQDPRNPYRTFEVYLGYSFDENGQV
jgi:ribosome assembly protein YihI (activator of Der GTPase)